MDQIEAEEWFLLEATAFDFEAFDHLPFQTIYAFCRAHGNEFSRGQVCQTALTYCNDSFKLPLALYYHPKVIAAACILQAMQFRR